MRFGLRCGPPLEQSAGAVRQNWPWHPPWLPFFLSATSGLLANLNPKQSSSFFEGVTFEEIRKFLKGSPLKSIKEISIKQSTWQSRFCRHQHLTKSTCRRSATSSAVSVGMTTARCSATVRRVLPRREARPTYRVLGGARQTLARFPGFQLGASQGHPRAARPGIHDPADIRGGLVLMAVPAQPLN